jgi:hypothetical protein
MEEETVDSFEAPFRFQPEGNKEDHKAEHATTDAAINIVTHARFRDD